MKAFRLATGTLYFCRRKYILPRRHRDGHGEHKEGNTFYHGDTKMGTENTKSSLCVLRVVSLCVSVVKKITGVKKFTAGENKL